LTDEGAIVTVTSPDKLETALLPPNGAPPGRWPLVEPTP
jgi:hypothetical protein